MLKNLTSYWNKLFQTTQFDHVKENLFLCLISQSVISTFKMAAVQFDLGLILVSVIKIKLLDIHFSQAFHNTHPDSTI